MTGCPREQSEDIPILVWAFINRRQTLLGWHVETIPASAMAALRAYAWPGNVRELENVIEPAHIRRVVEGSGWKIHGKGNAAEQVGLHPNTLRSRIQKLGIRRPARPA